MEDHRVSRWLRTGFLLGMAVVGVLPGLYMMLWFAWLSATPAWEHQSVGIVLGMTVSVAWTLAFVALGAAAVYSALRRSEGR